MGKKVIAIDLNPLSRTARCATISIVDNILRAVPNLTAKAKELSAMPRDDLEKVVMDYDNQRSLREAVMEIQNHLNSQFRP
jgi:4-phosphopantoate--beta-alanine ligase